MESRDQGDALTDAEMTYSAYNVVVTGKADFLHIEMNHELHTTFSFL